jgi:hypothetical protein
MIKLVELMADRIIESKSGKGTEQRLFNNEAKNVARAKAVDQT